MQTTDLRNLLRLYGLQTLKTVSRAVIVLLATAAPVSAQSTRGNYNYLDFQNKPYYFGITLGYNSSDYRVFRGKNFNIHNDSIAGVESVTGPGFNLQIISNLKLGENFDIRFLPGFAFAERSLEYDPSRRGRADYLKKIESVFVELPFQVRYKSAPYQDKRLFVLAGLKYSYDIQSRSRSRQATDLVKIAPTDFSIEYGAGVQMFFPYFIFSPEFKMSHGLGNILIYKQGFNESGILEKLLSRMFTISLHFEG
jgi:Outer membrane protein beta-barrel domain